MFQHNFFPPHLFCGHFQNKKKKKKKKKKKNTTPIFMQPMRSRVSWREGASLPFFFLEHLVDEIVNFGVILIGKVEKP
jgi:hypothetical protein